MVKIQVIYLINKSDSEYPFGVIGNPKKVVFNENIFKN